MTFVTGLCGKGYEKITSELVILKAMIVVIIILLTRINNTSEYLNI